jgi:hypothetical protein
MYTSILVPLDGSSFGEHALPLALSVARQSGAMRIGQTTARSTRSSVSANAPILRA